MREAQSQPIAMTLPSWCVRSAITVQQASRTPHWKRRDLGLWQNSIILGLILAYRISRLRLEIAETAKSIGCLRNAVVSDGAIPNYLAKVNSIARPLGGDVDGHTYQSYVIRVLEGGRKRRNELMTALARGEIRDSPGLTCSSSVGILH